jgi:hypothetical protein
MAAGRIPVLKLLGRRVDGVLLVDIGSAQCVALDMAAARVATVGDRESATACASTWVPLTRDEADTLRWPVQRALERARTVPLISLDREAALKAWDTRGRRHDGLGAKPERIVTDEIKMLGGDDKLIRGHGVAGLIKTPTGTKLFKSIAATPLHRANGDRVRQAIDPKGAPQAEREVLADRLDDALGLRMAPPAQLVEVEYKGSVEKGVAQDFVPNRPMNVAERRAFMEGRSAPAERARMGIFDAVIGNMDRHAGNFLVGTDGKLVAIDHGLAFGDSPITNDGVKELWSAALANIKEGDLSRDEQREIATRLRSLKWDDLLDGATLNARERATLRERATFVADKLAVGKAHEINATFRAKSE